ncbi:glycosyl transferase, WecB/TagA/CpsF family [Rhizobium sp. PDO1-076]|uniref:WecB/TagA/CpsF family glycosyltransferase n=1 Tax=Rhizobium sp. PDO1-076 TaxID=1125979 RepID=UPI00024E3021|nr:WecB/TagA/CpsF family glycosyltransferase [Rhizobium sp. PDO1-076]EHS54117.1 glycosyl transferase, WecB/TagA/CpsF family [Rhizobium sp. PDO1-076]
MHNADLTERQTDDGANTVRLGGLPIALIDMHTSAQAFVRTALEARNRDALPFYSTSANGQVIALAARDAQFRDTLLKAGQIHADGMPMVLLSRVLCRTPLPERVATTDLVHAVAELAEQAGVSFYFLGATEDSNQRAVAQMRAQYPNLVFAGSSNGYIADREEAVVAEIARLKPDILWIGMGVPYEQQFVARNLERLRGVGVIKTSGGLFDFLAGKLPRAPEWMQKAGLEWAYRLFREPRRLLVRYLSTNPIALYQLLTKSG